MAMAFAVAGLAAPAPTVTIEDPGCVTKTFRGTSGRSTGSGERPGLSAILRASMKGILVTIDGPAGSGKSSVARHVAGRLGLVNLNTGAAYRAAALIALREGADLSDGPRWPNSRAGSASTPRAPASTAGASRPDLRTPEVAAAASKVSANPALREVLLPVQRAAAEEARERGGAVVEGRDIGTVVLPDAELKVFLLADPRSGPAGGRARPGARGSSTASGRRSPRRTGRTPSARPRPSSPPPTPSYSTRRPWSSKRWSRASSTWRAAQEGRVSGESAFKGRSTPRRMSRRYDLFRRFMIVLCRVLFGLTIRGMEKVPEAGPLVVAANHTQYPDPVLVCMAIPRRMQWMGKKQLYEPRTRGSSSL
jgi:cytidylate kinase